MVYQQRPDVFDWTATMEAKNARTGTWITNHPEAPDNTFFRGNLSTVNTLKMFDDLGPPGNMPDEILGGGCSESCEMYETEYYEN